MVTSAPGSEPGDDARTVWPTDPHARVLSSVHDKLLEVAQRLAHGPVDPRAPKVDPDDVLAIMYAAGTLKALLVTAEAEAEQRQ